MPTANQGIRLDTRKLDRIIARMPDKGERLIAAVAMDVNAGAIANTTRVQTGTMRRGWRAVKLDRFKWRVGNSVFYAVFHEFGTTRLSASPMLGPAIEAARRRLAKRAAALFKP